MILQEGVQGHCTHFGGWARYETNSFEHLEYFAVHSHCQTGEQSGCASWKVNLGGLIKHTLSALSGEAVHHCKEVAQGTFLPLLYATPRFLSGFRIPVRIGSPDGEVVLLLVRRSEAFEVIELHSELSVAELAHFEKHAYERLFAMVSGRLMMAFRVDVQLL